MKLFGIAMLAALVVTGAGGRERVAATGSMSVARAAHSATLLPSGKVLVAGGCTLPGCDDVEGQTTTAELYDPKTRHFTPTGHMTMRRVSQAAVRLPGGSVLLAGGYSGREATAATEVYDPGVGRFRRTGSLLSPHADGAVVRLRDGRILFAGGYDGSRVTRAAELYTPTSGRSSPTGPLTIARSVATATLLEDGRVLVAGGQTAGGRVLASAELYDPRTGRFQRTGSMRSIRYKHGAALLGNGRVLVVGGASEFDLGARYRNAELYDPWAGRFSPAGVMSFARYHIPDAVVTLPSGRVLVGGDAPAAEVYDPAKRRFRSGGRLGWTYGP